mmetsp:Transcript_45098/g.129203  ORF Transcript_45098/g.129203 Transcript_45098/m.129203 type:complete len:229 (-) Transcript_45098:78-764(-)
MTASSLGATRVRHGSFAVALGADTAGPSPSVPLNTSSGCPPRKPMTTDISVARCHVASTWSFSVPTLLAVLALCMERSGSWASRSGLVPTAASTPLAPLVRTRVSDLGRKGTPPLWRHGLLAVPAAFLPRKSGTAPSTAPTRTVKPPAAQATETASEPGRGTRSVARRVWRSASSDASPGHASVTRRTGKRPRRPGASAARPWALRGRSTSSIEAKAASRSDNILWVT